MKGFIEVTDSYNSDIKISINVTHISRFWKKGEKTGIKLNATDGELKEDDLLAESYDEVKDLVAKACLP